MLKVIFANLSDAKAQIGKLHCIAVDKLLSATSGTVSAAVTASAAVAAKAETSVSTFTFKAFESSTPVASEGLRRLGAATQNVNAVRSECDK